ncbi:putative pro-neuregulin-3 membrane-bound [Scophthalmus maximus]|uniref:Putative pro-neuregulin-3 membrane-bound n=1 Tax=Scophthalmus maximus TaxID=52904 RepID=A0A2U9CPE3_SCOMX|nr:putative pro-neuregulin-3 membrane-bound [Scophthalmus maximus]
MAERKRAGVLKIKLIMGCWYGHNSCLPPSVLAVAPTLPSPRSEVFKPCVEDKDLAFCLNEGECSIIETVAGVHRHCSLTDPVARAMTREKIVVQTSDNLTAHTAPSH